MLNNRPKPGEVTVQYIDRDGRVRTEIQKSEYRVLRGPKRKPKAKSTRRGKSRRPKA